MRKAFNYLDHALFLQCLHQLGICSTESQLFSSYLSECVQRVKCNHSYFGWGPVLGRIQDSSLGPLLFLIYVNDILLQIHNGSLLQFADDTCLICYGDHTQVKDFLSSDLNSLARLIVTSKMYVNAENGFLFKSSKSPTIVLPILLEGTALVNVSMQKYLVITIDSNLTWAYHVVNVCKKMTYYLF